MDNALSGVGIDLGTTNSVIAFVNKKPNGELVSKVVEVPRAVDSYSQLGQTKYSSRRKPLLPSCVYYQMDNGYEPLVGDFAKSQHALRPQLVARSIKSQMGYEYAQNLAPEVIDKTPAQISARILSHMLRNTEKIYRTKITSAVITVPANFDAAMCKATLDAAKIAGIVTENEDGSERAILLSEPNAVIYDLINQISNGEIPASVLDLSSPRQIMVFDFGGGTLDITLHKIQYRDDSHSTVKVDEIATNRYTLLGGDNFDEVIAEEMFKRYLAKSSKYGMQIVEKLKRDKSTIMSQFLVYAEALKIDISTRNGVSVSEDDLWNDEEDEIFSVGGNLGNGYAYDDSFTKEEVEAVLDNFMGRKLRFDDYKQIDVIQDKNNIIYPILDVLSKAEKKLGKENVRVDDIILNGGMSRFYLVIDRLKEFFGLNPIIVTDPDQAVARGAAIYHYYLQQNYASLKADMRMISSEGVTPHSESKILLDSSKRPQESLPTTKFDSLGFSLSDTDQTGLPRALDSFGTPQNINLGLPTAVSTVYSSQQAMQPTAKFASPYPVMQGFTVDFGDTILNDALYLGLQNGAKEKELIPTGEALPYRSKIMSGFKIDAGEQKICLPIRSKDIDGSISTIVKGNIILKYAYTFDTYVSFIVSMSKIKVLTMDAWISKDYEGKDILETATVELAIGRSKNDTGIRSKLIAIGGAELNPDNEIQHIMNLLGENSRRPIRLNPITINKIKEHTKSIVNCANKNDFALPVLKELRKQHSPDAMSRLFTIARKIGGDWNQAQKKELAQICMSTLANEINGWNFGIPRTNVNIAAIYTLSMCGSKDDLAKLANIKNPKYTQSLLFTYGKTATNIPWLYDMLMKDIQKVDSNAINNIQFSAYAMGFALRRDEHSEVECNTINIPNLVRRLCDCLDTYRLKEAAWSPVIVAVGWMCDQRFNNSLVDEDTLKIARESLSECGKYSINVLEAIQKSKDISLKMIDGLSVNQEESEYLLKVVDRD